MPIYKTVVNPTTDEKLEQVLQYALDRLEIDPDSVEELADQLNNITKACAAVADDYDFPYQKVDPRISEAV